MDNSIKNSSLDDENGLNEFAISKLFNRNGCNKGFTLMELFIVIAIISTLASIALPNYLKYKNEAKVMAAITDIRLIEQEITDFIITNNQLPNNLGVLPNNNTVNDPWGNPYQYLDTQGGTAPGIRRNMSNNPVNLDYDLYSMGADGQTQTQFNAPRAQDDVVRAYDGRYVGLVSEL